jgi:hypothetical protein
LSGDRPSHAIDLHQTRIHQDTLRTRLASQRHIESFIPHLRRSCFSSFIIWSFWFLSWTFARKMPPKLKSLNPIFTGWLEEMRDEIDQE